MRVITVVLAAGTGKRLGGPKALLAWPASPAYDGGLALGPKTPAPAKGAAKELPLAVAHAAVRLGAESARVLVVTRKPMMMSLLEHVRPGLDLLASDASEDLGPAGSIACATAKIGDADIVIVTPVDTPPAKPDTVAALLAALAADPNKLAARPQHKGRSGHPVALRRAALDRYTAPQPPPLRDHLRALGDRVADVDVPDPAVLLDLNTPADVIALLRALPRFLDG